MFFDILNDLQEANVIMLIVANPPVQEFRVICVTCDVLGKVEICRAN